MKTPTNHRFRIGLLVAGILDDYIIATTKGARSAAKEYGVDLVLLPAKYIHRDYTEMPEYRYEYQYNSVIPYINERNVDGIIIALDSVGVFATRQQKEALLNTYAGIPVVLYAADRNDYPTVNCDNSTGVREALEYMIKNLHYTKLGMLTGSDANYDAKSRKDLFVSILNENGITVDDTYFSECDLSRHSEKAAIKLLDAHPDLEAIFCSNDDVAIGVYNVMRERGLTPGKDIAILGYDDTEEGAHLNPPLSTVHTDIYQVGRECVRLMVSLLKGEKVESVFLPSQFVHRGSIPYASVNPRESIVFKRTTRFNTYFNQIFYRYANNSSDAPIIETFREPFIHFLITTYDIFLDGKDTPENIELCDRLLDFLIQNNITAYADVSYLLKLLDKMLTALDASVETEDGKAKLRDHFLHIDTKLLENIDFSLGMVKSSYRQEATQMKLFIGNMLQFNTGEDSSYASILPYLKWVGIKDACLYIFEEPVIHYADEPFHIPEVLYAKAILKDGEASAVPANDQATFLWDIYGDKFLSWKHPASRILFPLFSKEQVYGVILCNMSDKLYENGEFFVTQLSSAVKMIYLLKKNEEMNYQLEESLKLLQANNLELNFLSMHDPLTGILNRRGFMQNAEQLLTAMDAQGRDCLFAFIDMNNLKIINDQFGHDDGDISLKTIAAISNDLAAANDGFCGRIGGDEFACIMPYSKDDGSSFVEDLYARFAVHNQNSDVAYNLTVSAGVYRIPAGQQIPLSEALFRADEKLYIEKGKRSKNVMKDNA